MAWRQFCAALAEFCCKKVSEQTIHVHTSQRPRIPANKKGNCLSKNTGQTSYPFPKQYRLLKEVPVSACGSVSSDKSVYQSCHIGLST